MTVGKRVGRRTNIRAESNYGWTGSASFECIVTSAGPPSRELTINGSRQFQMINAVVGPAFDVGPIIIFPSIGVSSWQNKFRFEDQLVVAGQKVAGTPTEDKTSGLSFAWGATVEAPAKRNLRFRFGFMRVQTKDAFPTNTSGVPPNGILNSFGLGLSYTYYGQSGELLGH